MTGITYRQRETLDAIKRLTVDGVPPTYQALADELGLVSKGSVHRLVGQLTERGFIERGRHYQSISVVGAEFSPAALDKLDDRDLRSVVAHAAGLLAHREGGSGQETADMLRRIADRLTGAPRG